MITKETVEKFLAAFHEKYKIYQIYFINRTKNIKALSELDITPAYREEVIKTITAEDYTEGPIIDTLNQLGELWVFGKNVKGVEVYIKISLGRPDNRTICISFHPAEHPMTYPFKNIKPCKVHSQEER